MRSFHCTPVRLTPTITPNVGNSSAQFFIAEFYLFLCQMKLKKLESDSDVLEEMIANLKFPGKAIPQCHLKSNDVS